MTSNSKLFSFIFLTIKASANNPNSNTFLPTILGNIQNGGSPLLPLKEDSWSIGALQGAPGLSIAQNIANQYFQINDQAVIPLPSNPWPSLNLQDSAGIDKVIINGLDNVYVTNFENYNYDEASQTVTADVMMQFNYWTNNPGGLNPGQAVTPLSLSTPFILTQELCASQSLDSTTCADPGADPISIIGNGTFTADITQLNFTASIQINVAPERSGLNLAITKLTLITTGDGAPQFKNVKAVLSNQSAFQSIISTLITNFMSSPDASEAVFSQMQDSLNTAYNINAISSTLNAQVGNFLDNRLGTVTGPLPSDEGQEDNNLVDLYLFDRIRYSLNNPTSSWYVQTLLSNYNNPSLNPFKPQPLDIGSFNIMGNFSLNDVTLSNIVISGFPNATVPAAQMILTPPSLNLAVVLGSLGVTTATASFSANYAGGTLQFDLTVTIQNVAISCVVTPSGDDATSLTVTFNSINFQIPNVSDLNIAINSSDPLAGAVQKVLNTPDVQSLIVSAVNSQFSSKLGAISTEVTSLIKTLLNQQLGNR